MRLRYGDRLALRVMVESAFEARPEVETPFLRVEYRRVHAAAGAIESAKVGGDMESLLACFISR